MWKIVHVKHPSEKVAGDQSCLTKRKVEGRINPPPLKKKKNWPKIFQVQLFIQSMEVWWVQAETKGGFLVEFNKIPVHGWTENKQKIFLSPENRVGIAKNDEKDTQGSSPTSATWSEQPSV